MSLNFSGGHSLHTGGVTGSIPVAPTTIILINQNDLADRRDPLAAPSIPNETGTTIGGKSAEFVRDMSDGW
jgi:hypothetical protein